MVFHNLPRALSCVMAQAAAHWIQAAVSPACALDLPGNGCVDSLRVDGSFRKSLLLPVAPRLQSLRPRKPAADHNDRDESQHRDFGSLQRTL